jgi:hypothetical protein
MSTTGTTRAAPPPSAAGPRLRCGSATPRQRRLFVHLLFALVQRLDGLRREAYGGDLDLAAIGEAIALCDGSPGRPVVTALAISRATGIPRETTRRKIKKLIALGVLSETRRGDYILTPAFAQRFAPDRLDLAMAETLRFFNHGLELGLYALSKTD